MWLLLGTLLPLAKLLTTLLIGMLPEMEDEKEEDEMDEDVALLKLVVLVGRDEVDEFKGSELTVDVVPLLRDVDEDTLEGDVGTELLCDDDGTDDTAEEVGAVDSGAVDSHTVEELLYGADEETAVDDTPVDRGPVERILDGPVDRGPVERIIDGPVDRGTEWLVLADREEITPDEVELTMILLDEASEELTDAVPDGVDQELALLLPAPVLGRTEDETGALVDEKRVVVLEKGTDDDTGETDSDVVGAVDSGTLAVLAVRLRVRVIISVEISRLVVVVVVVEIVVVVVVVVETDTPPRTDETEDDALDAAAQAVPVLSRPCTHWHVAEQRLPAAPFWGPSSHCSPPSVCTTPSPQPAGTAPRAMINGTPRAPSAKVCTPTAPTARPASLSTATGTKPLAPPAG